MKKNEKQEIKEIKAGLDEKLVEFVTMGAKIVEKSEKTLCHFHDNFKNTKNRDIGIEGWGQLEIMAGLWENGIHSEHPSKGADLILDDENRTKIELRMTTSFNPRYTIDGMIKYNNKHEPFIPVFFFSGYHPYGKKKPGDEVKVKERFNKEIKKNRTKQMMEKFDSTNFSLIYKIVNLGAEKGIVGIIMPSKESKVRILK